MAAEDPVAAARGGAQAFFAVFNDDGPEVAAARYWHPDVVWEDAPTFPDAQVHRGREAAIARMSERFEVLSKIEIEVLGVELIGNEALIETIVRGRGSASGVPIKQRVFFLIAIEGRLTTRIREFGDRGRALAAAGAGAAIAPAGRSPGHMA